MKNAIILCLIFGCVNFSFAQKFGLEFEIGGRGDNNEIVFARGGMQEVQADNLHLRSKGTYNYSKKLFYSVGIGLNHYGLKTKNMNSQFIFIPSIAESRFLIGVPLDVDYKLLTLRKLDFEVGTGIQFLFSGLINETLSSGGLDLEFDDPENRSSRRTVETERSTHAIANVHGRLVYNFSPKFAAYFNYQYNQGLGNIFTRTFEKNNQGDLASIRIATNGTGMQTAFGVRFTFKEKMK